MITFHHSKKANNVTFVKHPVWVWFKN